MFSTFLFRFVAVLLTFLVTENRVVSVAKGLPKQRSSEERLFIYITKISHPI